jgi:hypothetical protein
MNETDTLVILGDSWGCGAYTDFNGYRYEPDTKKYAPDYYFTTKFKQYYKNVVNLSMGGTTNIWNLDSLISFLNKTDINTSRLKILFIQTEPIRDLPGHWFFYKIKEYASKNTNMSVAWNFFKDKDYDMLNIIKFELEYFYYVLSIVAKKYNVTINLVGGLGALHPCVTQYKGINVLVNSWLQLIDPEYVPGLFTTIVPNIEPGTNPAIAEIYESYEQVLKMQKKWCGKDRNSGATEDIPNYLGYCTDFHPHHKGIDLLIDTIHDKIL